MATKAILSLMLKVVVGVMDILVVIWKRLFHTYHQRLEEDSTGNAKDNFVNDRISIDGSENIVCDLSATTITNSTINIHIGKDKTAVQAITNTLAVTPECSGDFEPICTSEYHRRKRRKKREVPVHTGCLPVQMPLIKKTGILKNKRYVTFARNLADLLMAGNREEIDRQLINISRLNLSSSAAADLQVVTLTYNGLAACFDLDIGEAWELHRQAKDILPYTENNLYLMARVVFLEGYIHRKEKKYLGKAQSCFKQSLQILQTTQACSYHGDCMYNMACIDYDIFRSKNPSRKCLKKIASNIRTATQYLYEDNSDITLHTRCRHMVKMANIIIDSDSHIGRSRDLTDVSERVNEARAILDELETDQKVRGGSSSKYVQCCLLQGRANCCFRFGEYHEAETLAENAFLLAEDAGFNAEMQSSRQLLVDINKEKQKYECASMTALPCQDDTGHAQTSEGCFADGSSNSEYDD
ncbi:uncharacterized protein LOC144444456 isoform X2 [Glandiceps talaboti]